MATVVIPVPTVAAAGTAKVCRGTITTAVFHGYRDMMCHRLPCSHTIGQRGDLGAVAQVAAMARGGQQDPGKQRGGALGLSLSASKAEQGQGQARARFRAQGQKTEELGVGELGCGGKKTEELGRRTGTTMAAVTWEEELGLG